MTAINAEFSGPDQSNAISVNTGSTQPADKPGLALLGAFFGGHRHLLQTRLTLGRGQSLRIEVHGHVSRMNKIVVVIENDGRIVMRGEEVLTLKVTRDGAALQLAMEFRAYGSMTEWIYLLAQDVRDGDGPVFSCGPTTLRPLPEAEPALYRRHVPVTQIDGVSAACQCFTSLNSGFSMIVEIQKPGSTLEGLRLSSQREFAHARWWTWDAQRYEHIPGELTACTPQHPISSPGLMDAFGPGFANMGHAISGVFADWHELNRMDTATADRMARMTLHARFSCGTEVDLPILEIAGGPTLISKGNILVEKYLTAARASVSERPRFLEIGARGASSALMRRKVESDWHYIGLDYAQDENVDIIADAHMLSEFVPHCSVDLVYSSEVMEHLMSPLRFVLEANRVLKSGGLFIARMPTTWPLHAEPWDFWRISIHGWSSLLNTNTGFEILESCEVGSSSIVPHYPQVGYGLMNMAGAPAPMLTMVVARKTAHISGDTSGWSPELVSGSYDHS